MKSRICIYQIHDENGIIHEYIWKWIKEIKKNHFKLIVVVNGEIKAIYKERLYKQVDYVVFRPDIGFDSGAFKEVILKNIMQEEKECLDELVLLNDTVFGPFIPLKKIFDEMNNRNCDFWGLTEQYEIKEYGYPYHIQPYFLVLKKAVLESKCFWDFWQKLKLPNDYHEAREVYEFRITEYLISNGFVPDAFIRNREASFLGVNCVEIIDRPLWAIENERLPVLKKRLFSKEYLNSNNLFIKYYVNKIIGEIVSKNFYDVDIIREYVVKNNPAIVMDDSGEIAGEKREIYSNEASFLGYSILNEKNYRFVMEMTPIWIYGAGFWGNTLTELLKRMRIDILGIIVQNKSGNPAMVNGIKVYSIEDVIDKVDVEQISVFIAVDNNEDIYKHLKEMGIRRIARI